MKHFAHSLPNEPPDSWELLEAHLSLVAEYATRFADRFEAPDIGRTLGLWHDIGKYSREFQAYLHRENGFEAHLETTASDRVDHSTAGAQLACQLFGNHPYGRMLAYCVAGHHAGLADAVSEGGSSGLDQRLIRSVPSIDDAPTALLQKPELPVQLPITLDERESSVAFQLAFFTRMLFSCLVDADYLATEEFLSPDKTIHRRTDLPSMQTLADILDQHLMSLSNGKTGPVADARADVLDACRRAARKDRGLYSLTVPTGGGKTLSSLTFGLSHAGKHRMDRIIYAIPFTSIIEQTADVFRSVFSSCPDEVVLEHHSNTDPDRETVASRLVTQNWDAPIVVTTNVQFFESLFASKTSRCRKLHNICNRVIILDEVQAIPVDVLRPALAVIQELVRNYGCTIVLCTATQPALSRSADFPIGLTGITEIIPAKADLFRRLKRVQITNFGRLSNSEIAERLVQQDQFLCIVNTRSHAAELYERVQAEPDPSEASSSGSEEDQHTFHLSTLMCGQHLRRTLDKIRARLKAGLPCQVVSTQLIEAGDDDDFPIVYRSLAGIDSIAQAAGRCNREGRLRTGHVVVFEAADVQLRGYLKSTAESASELLVDLNDSDLELLDADIVRRYFELHFWRHAGRWDANEVMDCFPEPWQKIQFNFRTAAQRFQWIRDASESVFVPYDDEAVLLIERLRELQHDVHAIGELRAVLRRLQQYSVNLFPQAYAALINADIEPLPSGHAVLVNQSCYDDQLGFRIDRSGYHDPGSLIT
jgi:CRISPR-associated endonuclease/helicase Cas3